MVELLLDDERHGPSLDRFAGEGVAVDALAADAEEERSGDNGSRVVCELAYLDGRGVGDGRRSERSDDSLQVHAGRVYQRHSVVPEGAHLQQKCAICGSFVTHTLALAPPPGYAHSGEEDGGPGLFRAVLTGRGQ